MEHKPHIILCSHALNIGGAERSLLDMLNCIDYNRVDVDLFLYRHEGEWMNQIPKEVKLLPEIPQYASLAVPMKSLIKRGQFGVLLGRLNGKLRAKHYDKKHPSADSAVALEYSHKYTVHAMPDIQPKVKYDLAISYLTPHYIVAEKVKARTKIAWIHTDYSMLNINIDSELQMWSRYDYIASISEQCTASFVSKFPTLADRIIPFENLLSQKLLEARAIQEDSVGMTNDTNTIKLLSIGRYSPAKNFDQVPEMCKILHEKGLPVIWYIIGYGDEREIVENIRLHHMEDQVILLGKKENPYPYIQACDVYIQPSRYEGKAVTVREAQMLHKPVIITKYPTSASQLEDGEDGFIVPMDTVECAEAIADLLSAPDKLKTIAENTRNHDYSNRQYLETLYQLAE